MAKCSSAMVAGEILVEATEGISLSSWDNMVTIGKRSPQLEMEQAVMKDLFNHAASVMPISIWLEQAELPSSTAPYAESSEGRVEGTQSSSSRWKRTGAPWTQRKKEARS